MKVAGQLVLKEMTLLYLYRRKLGSRHIRRRLALSSAPAAAVFGPYARPVDKLTWRAPVSSNLCFPLE